MKTPNITARHLFGGFLGSVSGILIAGYTKPHSAVLACLGLVLGTIAGYLLGHWADEIVEECLNAHMRFRVLWKNLNTSRITFFRNITNAITTWWARWTGRFGFGLRSVSPLLYYVGKGILWLLLLPVHIVTWLVGRPMRVVITLRVLVLLSVAITTLALSYMLFPTVGNPGSYDRFFSVLPAVLLVGLLTFVPLEQDDVRKETFSHYQKEGPFHYALKECFLSPLRFLWILLFVCGLCLLAVIAIPLVIVGVLGNIMIGGVLWGLWKATFRKGHLLGLSVTLVVTVTSAIMNWNHLQGVLLWVIAIGTGVISGVCAEGARRFLAYILPKIVSEKVIKGDPFDTVEIIGKLVWRRMRPLRKRIGLCLSRVVSSGPVNGFTEFVTGH